VLYEAASIAAQRAYMCYQSKAIFQTQKQGNSSSSGGTSNPKSNNIELCRPVQQKLNQKIKLLKEVSGAITTLIIVNYTRQMLILYCRAYCALTSCLCATKHRMVLSMQKLID
jgi:hypothetical protein